MANSKDRQSPKKDFIGCEEAWDTFFVTSTLPSVCHSTRTRIRRFCNNTFHVNHPTSEIHCHVEMSRPVCSWCCRSGRRHATPGGAQANKHSKEMGSSIRNCCFPLQLRRCPKLPGWKAVDRSPRSPHKRKQPEITTFPPI